MRLTISLVAALAASVLFADRPNRIIFDTDLCGDYDDVGALAVLNALADEGVCEIAAVVSSTRSSPALGMSELVNRWYGRTDLPMGVCKEIGYVDPNDNMGPVFRELVAKADPAVRYPSSDAAPDANAICRKVLAESSDKSVTICTVGALTNFRRLLETGPDEVSPLAGRDLVARKVKAWYVMGGVYPKGNECNFRLDAESSGKALAASPVPVYIVDFNLGADVLTGVPVSRTDFAGGPVAETFARCMKIWHETNKGRPSWDEITVLAAAQGWERYFTATRGTMAVVNEKGDNVFTESETGNHHVLGVKTPKADLARVIDELMLRPPRTMKPYVWWHWAGTCVTKDGILRDLDAMAETGIGGATIFQVARGPCSEIPAEGYVDDVNPDLVFGSDAWFDLVTFAAKEAKKRGLEIGMHNCPGYTVSGGPWITPELAMKKLVWSVAPKGETPPEPESKLGFYREIGTVEKDDKVYRFGYTCTGSQCMPVPAALIGNCLEADKMSAKAIDFHLDRILRRDCGLDFILMDSYEAGDYDWTDDFRDEFAKRRGYDPLESLPAYVGAVEEGAAKIKADMALTVKELSTERHYWRFRDRLHAKGLRFYVEPYGGPFDLAEAAYASDMPTTEFWGARPFWVPEGEIGGRPQIGGAAGRAAGRTILAAEAFTAMPFQDPFVLAPKDFKACADASFARGINRLLLHHWVHQPFPACRKPGMNMGYWGAHFGENATWYEPGKAFVRYLSECQKWLQCGEEVVNVLGVGVEPKGGDRMDVIPVRVFLEGTVSELTGLTVRDSGRTYNYLHVSDELKRDPAVAKRIEEVTKDGLVLLTDKGEAGGHFRILEGVEVTENGPVLATERRVKSGERFYFIANVSTNAVSFLAEFMEQGVPEVHDLETYEVTRGDVRPGKKGESLVKFDLPPLSSRVVVFKAESDLPREARPVLFPHKTGPLGSWTVMFEPNRGAPEGPCKFETLGSWTESDDPGIRYFSGTATYRTTFTVGKEQVGAFKTILSLGDVRDIARVRIDGRDLGVVWHYPFELDTRDLLSAEGVHTLEIEVTNGWHNRLIGDRALPEDCEWGPERFHQCHLDGTKGDCGHGLKTIPTWAWNADGARPSSNRVTFTAWDYAGTDLVPSGLLGPVTLISETTETN